MDELMQDFLSETTELLEELGTEVVVWENNPADRERLDAIFRCVHTIKGSSSFLNLPRIGALAHAAEDALDGVRTGKLAITTEMVNAILAIIDRISVITGHIANEGQEPAGSDGILLSTLTAASVMAMSEAGMEASGAGAHENTVVERKIRVPLELLDRLMNGVSDMVLARNEVSRCFREGERTPELDSAFERLSARIADTRMIVSQMRMQRIEKLFSAMPRTVRDLAGKLHKQVNLVIEGGDVEIDREMIEVIRDPLMHIVRNSIDHGLEDGATRRAAGKEEVATLAIAARQSGNQIVIEVADDGRGIAVDRVVTRAVERRIVSAADIAQMNDKEKLKLIFMPGFSTATKVTDVSGRGVGMDVVRANVERVGGVVELENREGQGLTVRLRVPMTLTIVSALTLTAGGQSFAIPRTNIVEILLETNDNARIDRAGGADLVYLRGERLALVKLDAILGIAGQMQRQEDKTLIIVRPASGKPYALCVDDAVDQEELVIRPAAPQIMTTGFYAGATLPDSGEPMLLLDPSGIAEQAAIFELDDTLSIATDSDEVAEKAKEEREMLLLREFDGTTRAIALEVVERVEEIDMGAVQYAAGKWRITIDGEMVPIFPSAFDAIVGRVKLLRISDGERVVGYLAADVIDLVRAPNEFVPAPLDGLIAGIARINDMHVEIIDPHFIFSEADRVQGAGEGAARPLCRINYGDQQWVRQFLAPLIENAGYDIVFGQDETSGNPVLAVVGADDPLTDDNAGVRKVIRLRHRPSRGDGDDDSIYRYDRAALLHALRQSTGAAE